MSQLDPTQLQLKALDDRINNFEQFIKDKFSSRDKAIELARLANDKRFDSVNEFRQVLTDQNQSFVHRATFETAHSVLGDKVDIVTKQVVAMDTTLRSKIGSITNGPTFLIGVCSIAVVLIISVVGSAIQLGAVQTHVTINTDALALAAERERKNTTELSRQEAEISVLQNQQQAHLNRLGRIENFFFNKAGLGAAEPPRSP